MIIALCITLAIVSGMAKAVKDLSGDGKLNHWGFYWMKDYSWRYKYKNGEKRNGPAFFGSTTFLVSFTDGWHRAQSVYIWSLGFALLLWPLPWWWGIGLVLLMLCVFTLCYHRPGILDAIREVIMKLCQYSASIKRKKAVTR